MRTLAIILVIMQGGASAALAQGAARPNDGAGLRQTRIAGEFARGYLKTWSARNNVALGASPGFYGQAIRFHGQDVSAPALLQEKRRFVQRWPVRNYRHRLSTMRVDCNASQICTIRSLFDYSAASPRRSASSHGTGRLRLDVDFRGARPVILSEDSRVIRRTRGG